MRSIIEEQPTKEEILWRWQRWWGDEAILLNQANSNLFCRDREKKMDSFSVYPLSQLLSPQEREEGKTGSKMHLEIKGRFPC